MPMPVSSNVESHRDVRLNFTRNTESQHDLPFFSEFNGVANQVSKDLAQPP